MTISVPAAGSELCRCQFRCHTAGANIACRCALSHFSKWSSSFLLHGLIPDLIAVRIIRKQTVNIRQQEQQICIDQCRYGSQKAYHYHQTASHTWKPYRFHLQSESPLILTKFPKGIQCIKTTQIVHNGTFGHQDLCCQLIVFRKSF